MVLKKIDPVGDRRQDRRRGQGCSSDVGECSDAYLRAHQAGWRNAKHRQQWIMTLTRYCADIRSIPVDRVDGVEFEVAEACLAHVVGNSVVQAYQRSSMLERRRPLMESWSRYVTSETSDPSWSASRSLRPPSSPSRRRSRSAV
jgi:hypothetical protein